MKTSREYRLLDVHFLGHVLRRYDDRHSCLTRLKEQIHDLLGLSECREFVEDKKRRCHVFSPFASR